MSRFRNAVGGSDGRKYYVSMEDENGVWSLFLYDTEKRIWIREEEHLQVLYFGSERELTFLDTGGRIWLCPNAADVPEDAEKEDVSKLCSFVEFGDFTYSSPDKKGISKLQVRLEAQEGSTVTVLIRYDSSGDWEEVKALQAEKKQSFYLPIIPRRCDHFRLKFKAVGPWKLYSLSAEVYAGSAL